MCEYIQNIRPLGPVSPHCQATSSTIHITDVIKEITSTHERLLVGSCSLLAQFFNVVPFCFKTLRLRFTRIFWRLFIITFLTCFPTCSSVSDIPRSNELKKMRL